MCPNPQALSLWVDTETVPAPIVTMYNTWQHTQLGWARPVLGLAECMDIHITTSLLITWRWVCVCRPSSKRCSSLILVPQSSFTWLVLPRFLIRVYAVFLFVRSIFLLLMLIGPHRIAYNINSYTSEAIKSLYKIKNSSHSVAEGFSQMTGYTT